MKEAPTSSEAEAPSTEVKYILFYGNSLTAGYGLEEGEDFPSRVQEKIDAANLPYKVVNAGLSGETTAGGKSRLSWILKQPVDIFVLELGGNDALRGFDLATTRQNLEDIILKVKEEKPGVQVILAGMQAPPNMGSDYTEGFETIYSDLAVKHNLPLIPFLLDGVGGNPDLNLEDRIHPNVEGQKIVANNVWKVLKPLL